MASPAQKPHRSVQEVETPPELIAAVEHRFGRIDFDLAASPNNAKAPSYFTKENDTLAQDWRLEGENVRVAWLNCEFGDAKRYAQKCAAETSLLQRWTLLLVPMGTQEWACEFVWPSAYVLKLKGRVAFVGHGAPFPKDLLVAAYGYGMVGEEVWDWRKQVPAQGVAAE